MKNKKKVAVQLSMSKCSTTNVRFLRGFKQQGAVAMQAKMA
jgi:hypothetical protein